MKKGDQFSIYAPVWDRPSGPGHLVRDLGLVRDPSDDMPSPPVPPGPILLPPPDSAPELPLVPRPRVPVPVEQLPLGPWDVREPIKGDPWRYPELVPPPSLALSDKIDAFLLATAREFVDRRGRPYPKDDGQQPAPPDRQLPPGEVPPDRQLSSLVPWMTPSDRQQVESILAARLSTTALSDPAMILEDGPPVLPSKKLEQMNAWLKANGIRHFKAHELIKNKWKNNPGRVSDLVGQWFLFDFFDAEATPDGVFPVIPSLVLPPPWMWPNILPALRVLDRFRHYLGKPVNVWSSYRHPLYNSPRHLEGSKTSFHMSFAAIDFTYSARRPDGHLDTGVFVEWFERTYRQKGDGVGRYGKKFIHLDVGLQRHLLRSEGKRENWWDPHELRGVLP